MYVMRKIAIVILSVLIVLYAVFLICTSVPFVRDSIIQTIGFVPGFVESLFGLCAAFLYGIGFLLGWSYEEASVYICIYLWPLLLTATLLPLIVVYFKKLRVKHSRLSSVASVVKFILIAGYSSLYVLMTEWIYEHYNQPTVNEQFQQCVNDLSIHANHLGLTYYQINIVLYLGVFALIAALNLLLAWIGRKY